MKSLLDKDFKYVPAVETNIRKTFARIRREQAEEAARLAEVRTKVAPIKKLKAEA